MDACLENGLSPVHEAPHEVALSAEENEKGQKALPATYSGEVFDASVDEVDPAPVVDVARGVTESDQFDMFPAWS